MTPSKQKLAEMLPRLENFLGIALVPLALLRFLYRRKKFLRNRPFHLGRYPIGWSANEWFVQLSASFEVDLADIDTEPHMTKVRVRVAGILEQRSEELEALPLDEESNLPPIEINRRRLMALRRVDISDFVLGISLERDGSLCLRDGHHRMALLESAGMDSANCVLVLAPFRLFKARW